MNYPNKLFPLISLFALLSCGGGSDSPEPTPTPPTPTVTAPNVVTTIPANNATDIAVGAVNVRITYDKDIIKSSDASLQPTVSGGSLSGTTSVSGKNLAFSVNCTDYDTKVTITIPKGLIGVSGALADAYTLSFTTAKQPESPSSNISVSPVVASTDAAKMLYTYFREQYGQKVISSVMADVNWNNKNAEKVNTLTGKYRSERAHV